MITSLNIQHFRSIENIELKLEQINVFVGQNGAGKSNIIDAFRFIRDAIETGLDQAVADRHGMTHGRQWSPNRPYDVSLNVKFRIFQGEYSLIGIFGFTISSSKDQHSVKRELFDNTYEEFELFKSKRGVEF